MVGRVSWQVGVVYVAELTFSIYLLLTDEALLSLASRLFYLLYHPLWLSTEILVDIRSKTVDLFVQAQCLLRPPQSGRANATYCT